MIVREEKQSASTGPAFEIRKTNMIPSELDQTGRALTLTGRGKQAKEKILHSFR